MSLFRRSPLVASLVLLATFATACGGGKGNPCKVPADKVNEDGVSVGIAFDVGGIGDKSFNDAAKAGLDQAIDDGLVSEATCIEPDATGSNRDENVISLADQGFDIVLGIGFAFSPGINANAAKYPDVSFAVIDGYATCPPEFCSDIPNPAPANVADLTFKEHEGSFLVGAAAALKAAGEGCTTIGFLGGQTGTLIGKFEAGYKAGALAVNPDMEILVEYIGDDVTAFNDAVSGEALSTSMYDDGACIIYHAAGASGAGLFTAAVKANKLAIGVDSDQYQLVSAEQQPLVLTSMLKRVDTAVRDAIAAVSEGTFQGATAQVFGLAEQGVDYSQSNAEILTPDIVAKLDEFKQQIIDGTIVVPEDPAAV
jgi:basic membrane protein A